MEESQCGVNRIKERKGCRKERALSYAEPSEVRRASSEDGRWSYNDAALGTSTGTVWVECKSRESKHSSFMGN